MAICIYDIPFYDLLRMDQVVFDEIEESGILCFIRAQRFVDGYYVKEHITELYKDFFGNTNILQEVGLQIQYEQLKQKVSDKRLMGLVLNGMNLKNIVIDTYQTVHNMEIELSVESISKCLVRNYFTKAEVYDLCRKQGNFNIYYNGD
jgi:hypothetical protein